MVRQHGWYLIHVYRNSHSSSTIPRQIHEHPEHDCHNSDDLPRVGNLTSNRPSSMTAIRVESVLAVLESCKAALRARNTLVCFCLVATIAAGVGELCMFVIPAMPIAVMTPGRGLDAKPEAVS